MNVTHVRGKETTMKFKVMTTIFALVLVAGFVALAPSLTRERLRYRRPKHETETLHVTKECSKYTGAAGDYCTITSSNLDAIAVGAKVFYDQAAGIPGGLLDSNVVLVDAAAGPGNWAVGHCTLDLGNYFGLCTFSDGTGEFTGFSARVVVSPPTDGSNFHWDGTYRFSPEPPR